MKISSVSAVYFSAAGNTKKVTEFIAGTIAGKLDIPLEIIDFTYSSGRHGKEFTSDQLIVFGMPVYAGRIPNKMLPYVQSLFKGNQTLAVPVVTFGNRNYDNALFELCHELQRNGFHTVAAAACPASHVFSEIIAPDRPDEQDFERLRVFAEQIAENTFSPDKTQEPVSVPGDENMVYYTPLGEDGRPVRFLKAKPQTNSRCTGCMLCAAVCPMDAIDTANPDLVPGTCIKCHSCIKKCPGQAKYFADPDFLSHVKMLEKTYVRRAEMHLFF